LKNHLNFKNHILFALTVNDHTMSGKDTCSDTQESVQQVAADSTVESSDQNMMETSDSEGKDTTTFF